VQETIDRLANEFYSGVTSRQIVDGLVPLLSLGLKAISVALEERVAALEEKLAISDGTNVVKG